MKKIEKILDNYVKENGISKIIIDYKKDIERNEKINKNKATKIIMWQDKSYEVINELSNIGQVSLRIRRDKVNSSLKKLKRLKSNIIRNLVIDIEDEINEIINIMSTQIITVEEYKNKIDYTIYRMGGL